MGQEQELYDWSATTACCESTAAPTTSDDTCVDHDTSCISESISDITQLLPSGWSASADGLHRQPLLHQAVTTGHIEIVKVLLENGATVNALDTLGSPALFLAVRNGNLKMAELLLSYHANPNCADTMGATPLEMAVGMADISVVRLLLQHGARIA